MIIALLCFVVVQYRAILPLRLSEIKLLILPISFRINPLAAGQSYDYPSANETTMKNMGR